MNFTSYSEKHCILKDTDELYVNKMLIARFDIYTKKYEIICDDEQIINDLFKIFEQIYEENKKEKEAKRLKMIQDSKKAYQKARKKEFNEMIEKINKSKKDF